MGENGNLGGELPATAQVMKLLRLGQFLPELVQPLLVGRSRLWIKDFPDVAEPLGVIEWQTGILKRMGFSGSLAQVRTNGDSV